MNNLNQIKAKDIMQINVIHLQPEMNLFDAAKLLQEANISGAPVLNKDNEIVGVISQNDLLKHSLENEYTYSIQAGFYHDVPFAQDIKFFSGTSLNNVLVKEIMSPYVITVDTEDSVSHIARLLRGHKFHRVIVTKENKLHGIISTIDLLKLLEDIK